MLLLSLRGIPLLMLTPGLCLSGRHLLLLLWRDRAYWILTRGRAVPVSYTHLRAHETSAHL
eukprot:7195852-Alexandrium_andersonii.AAC.1